MTEQQADAPAAELLVATPGAGKRIKGVIPTGAAHASRYRAALEQEVAAA